MPHITNETPTQVITISGGEFIVPKPFAEGHTLTVHEASALNQVFAENVRNNMATSVKDGKAGQAEVTAYAHAYEFGVRRGGGARVSDPVRAKAIEFMEDKVRTSIKDRGLALKDYKQSEIRERATAILDNPSEAQKPIVEKIWALARSTIEEQRAVGGLVLDSHESTDAKGKKAKHPEAAA